MIWIFLFEYFRNINILELILYSIILYNYSQIHSEVFSFVHDFFSRKDFHENLMFFFVFIFHYYVIDFNIKNIIKYVFEDY